MPAYKKSILLIVTFLYILLFFYNIFLIRSKSYIVRESDLRDLGEIHMLDRGIMTSSGKSSSYSVRFMDEMKWKEFDIDGSWLGPRHKYSELYDSLQYSELIMRIKTDEEGYRIYHHPAKKGRIKVWGLSIRGKEYMSLENFNKRKRKGLGENLIALSIAYLLFILIFFFGKSKEEKRETV